MESIHIRGLVRLARSVKREFGLPLSEERFLELRGQVKNALGIVQRTLTERGTGPEGLPPPSRRAYEQLRDWDASGYPHHDAAQLRVGLMKAIWFPGLKSAWSTVLKRMASTDTAFVDNTYAKLSSLSNYVEHRLVEAGPERILLDKETCGIRGWLRHFSQRDRFDAYRAAVIRASTPVAGAMRDHKLWYYFRIFFQPLKGVFRRQQKLQSLNLRLPRPMLTFDEQGFELVARAAFAGGARDELRAAMHAPEYQAMQAELDALGSEGLAKPLAPACTPE